MADNLSFEFRGFDTLAKSMAAFGKEISEDGAKRMVRAGGLVFKQEIVERAPVLTEKNQGSNSLEPGALKNDVHVYQLKGELVPTAAVGFGKTGWIATLVEYGHRLIHGTKTFGDVPAHPFVRPSFEAANSSAEAAMVKSFHQTVENMNHAQ
jgi:HK97 gp10 family phage protein